MIAGAPVWLPGLNPVPGVIGAGRRFAGFQQGEHSDVVEVPRMSPERKELFRAAGHEIGKGRDAARVTAFSE